MESKENRTINMVDSNSDNELLEKSLIIRKTIASALNRKKLINVITEIVDESECFEFKSERSKKFINSERPLLLLLLDVEKAKTLYPEYVKDLASRDIEVQRDVRKAITQVEISNLIMDFFTGMFLYIKTNEFPSGYAKYEEKILNTTKNIDIPKLKAHINNFFTVDEELEELGFAFTIITVTGYPEEEEIFDDNSIYLEILY